MWKLNTESGYSRTSPAVPSNRVVIVRSAQRARPALGMERAVEVDIPGCNTCGMGKGGGICHARWLLGMHAAKGGEQALTQSSSCSVRRQRPRPHCCPAPLGSPCLRVAPPRRRTGDRTDLSWPLSFRQWCFLELNVNKAVTPQEGLWHAQVGIGCQQSVPVLGTDPRVICIAMP